MANNPFAPPRVDFYGMLSGIGESFGKGIKVLPGRLMRKIQNIDLAPVEYETYQTRSGELTKAFLNKLITAPGWDQLPDDVKADAISDVMRKARDVGRALTMQQHPDLMLRIAEEKSQKKSRSTSPVALSAGQSVSR